MDSIKHKLFKENAFYVLLSISSGFVFASIFRKLDQINSSKGLNVDISQLSKKQTQLEKLKVEEKRDAESPGSASSKMKLKVPKDVKDSKNTLLDELKFLMGATCEIFKIGHIAWSIELSHFPNILSPLLSQSKYRTIYGGEGFLPDESFIFLNSFVLSTASFGPHCSLAQAQRWLRAGPRKHNFFVPEEVKAVIVTCGGLCPGLNVVIREIVMSLYFNYKVKEIWGIQFGYKGFYGHEWVELNPEKVKVIHKLGGTILGSARGGFDKDEIINQLKERGINHVYAIGGDGTHKGILELYKEITKQKLKIVICGLPKTIDNDIPIIDKSFGFESAVEEAVKAIQSAYIESHCAEYGVGLVRLMGRYAGFIAMEASSASRDVNICLVPEFKFNLYGKNGFLEYVAHRVEVKRHCVIVVAEGAGEAMLDAKIPDLGKDAGGNIKAGDIGIFLKDQITDFCKKKKIDLTLKYIDPTYMIRTVPANSYDKKLCSQLAQNATHGLMAGYTGFSVGHVNNRTVFIPIEEIVSNKYANRILPYDRAWQRLLASTGQPSFINEEEKIVEKLHLVQ